MYEGVVADENADVADAVAAGLEEEIAGFRPLRLIFARDLPFPRMRGVSYRKPCRT